MKKNFDEALRRVLVHEGGKVDDPRDPGGRTNRGVTQRTFNAYLQSIKKKPRDVFTMTDAECKAIYKRRYWDVVKGDQLPPGIDYVVFDGAVNSGSAQSVKWLQRALGVTVDGELGLMTMQSIDKAKDHDELVSDICARRLAFLRALKHWRTYKNGWTSRVSNVKAVGQAWAMGSVGPEVVYVAGAETKAEVSDAKAMPHRSSADATAGAGATIATGAQAVTQAKEQLEPLQEVSYVPEVLALLTVVGIVLLVGGIAYRWYVTRKRKERADALGLETA